jgi:hypothetical protein
VAERRVRAPEVSEPLGQGRPRPFGITAAAVILILLSSLLLVLTAMHFRCAAVLKSYPPICESVMQPRWTDGWHGYIAAGFHLAFFDFPCLEAFAVGVVAGVRLLGLRSRGLALGLAGVGILLWLRIPGPGTLGDPEGMYGNRWPGSAYDMSSSSAFLAIKVLAVAGYIYVILTLLGWWVRFDKAKGSVAAPLGSSTFPPPPAPPNSEPGRFSVVVVVSGAGLVLAGLVFALPGLAVFIDWIAGVVERAAGPGAFCPPEYSDYCLASSGSAGVLGLLAASVGTLGLWAGVMVLRKLRTVRAVSPDQRAQAAIVSRS